jgi:hypothetical protein
LRFKFFIFRFRTFSHSIIMLVSTASAAALLSLIHCQARDANTRKADSVYVLFCPLSVSFPLSAFVHGGVPQMGGYYLLKSNGGDSGNRIFVLYWRCPLIRVSVITGSTVLGTNVKKI